LIELHLKYYAKVQAVLKNIEEDDPEEIYFLKLDAGLYFLQLVDLIIAYIASAGLRLPAIKEYLFKMLNQKDISDDQINTTLEEYINHYGDAAGEEVKSNETKEIKSLMFKKIS